MSSVKGKIFIHLRHPLLWIFLLISFPTLLTAQAPYFRVLKLPENLLATTINCLYQDHTGVIWLGTGDGLYHFNGKNFLRIPAPKNTTPLQVSSLYMDGSNVLWVGTKKGNIYRLTNDSLTAYQPQEGLPGKAITGFASDDRGNLWFSTYGEGLYYYNGRYLYNLNTDDGLSDDYCYCIASDKSGRIYAATDEGVSVCFASGKLKKVSRITTDQGLPDNIVLSLVPDQNGLMWVGMQDGGICSIDFSTLKVTVPPVSSSWNHGPVRDILVFNKTLWVSSEKKGLLELNPDDALSPISYNSVGNFEFHKVNCLMADNQGNCWITTNNDLIFSAGPGFKMMKSILNKPLGNIQSILYDRSGNIWYSNEGKLFRFPANGLASKPPQELRLPATGHTHIISLYEDTLGFIWAGTFGNGVFRINPKTAYTRHLNEKDGLSNGNILSISGRGNIVWLATLGGAFCCNLKSDASSNMATLKFVNYNQKNGPGNNYIYSVFIDRKNRVWFGTDGKGISVLENGRFTGFGEASGLKSNIIYSITEDSEGNIWFTTSSAGVYCFDGKKFKNYSTSNGLSDNQISSIATDKHQHVLFAYNRGIDILDVKSGSFVYYGSEMGLESIDPDLNVITGNNKGKFWLGTSEGIVSLETPQDNQPKHPSLLLNKVLVFLGNENCINRHSFAFNQNHLSFFFNAAWYIAPDLVTYQIKLEGYDLDWIDTRDNLATYSSLPPGKYTFHVRAALKANYSDSVEASYYFEILNPFWKTKWFLILSFLAVAAGVYYIIRSRESRIKKREALEHERLLYQFQTLRSQVNPHFLFNSFSTLISVIDDDKVLAIEYVQKLSQFFRNILEYRDKDLITIGEELKLIETYRYLQQQRYGENFSIEITIADEQKATLIPPLALQMIIENAIKHNIVSSEKPLMVRIYCEDNLLVIQNNLQRKKLSEPSTGIGLANILNRYKLLGLEGMVVQETNTDFIIQLPLIKPS